MPAKTLERKSGINVEKGFYKKPEGVLGRTIKVADGIIITPISVIHNKPNATIMRYQNMDREVRKVVSRCKDEEYDEKKGERACLLKAIRREVIRELKSM